MNNDESPDSIALRMLSEGATRADIRAALQARGMGIKNERLAELRNELADNRIASRPKPPRHTPVSEMEFDPDCLYHKPAEIEGVTAEQGTDVDNIWAFAAEAQRIVFEKHARRQRQTITLPGEPVAIAFLSDLHIGSPGTDYMAIKSDAELIRDTPGLYAGFHGDATDNWIVGKLTALQRGQAIGFDAERLLFEDWVSMVAPKLLWFVQGNHDNWSEQLIGSAPNRDLIKGASMLWDRNQCIFDLHHCGHTRKVVIRHKWRYSSVYNPAHGMMVGFDRGDIDFDIAVAGHTHIATLCYPFYKLGRIRHAILTGAYKKIDPFGEEVGFPSPKRRGSGALVMDTNGDQMFIDDLSTAAKFLAFLRSQQ